tara:strand:- start:125 stop:286 length:162 start_codon:yes stop_codon:yes gene_type:complete
MNQESITISKKEYEELLSLKETMEILENRETMNKLKRSIEQAEKGELIPISEL